VNFWAISHTSSGGLSSASPLNYSVGWRLLLTKKFMTMDGWIAKFTFCPVLNWPTTTPTTLAGHVNKGTSAVTRLDRSRRLKKAGVILHSDQGTPVTFPKVQLPAGGQGRLSRESHRWPPGRQAVAQIRRRLSKRLSISVLQQNQIIIWVLTG